LPSMDEDQVYPDEDIKLTLAERILAHLTISEELCVQEYNIILLLLYKPAISLLHDITTPYNPAKWSSDHL